MSGRARHRRGRPPSAPPGVVTGWLLAAVATLTVLGTVPGQAAQLDVDGGVLQVIRLEVAPPTASPTPPAATPPGRDGPPDRPPVVPPSPSTPPRGTPPGGPPSGVPVERPSEPPGSPHVGTDQAPQEPAAAETPATPAPTSEP